MWLIEEYAIILRKRVWFKPPNPPANPDRIDDKKMISVIGELMWYDRRSIGAIFWIVIRTMHCPHPIPCITGGNQRCKGAAPIFNNKAILINKLGLELNKSSVGDLAKIAAEPKAWIRKYFKAASAAYILSFDEIIGIKDRRFNSNPIQAVNHDGDEIAIKTPNIRVHMNNIRLGLVKIKKRNTPS